MVRIVKLYVVAVYNKITQGDRIIQFSGLCVYLIVSNTTVLSKSISMLYNYVCNDVRAATCGTHKCTIIDLRFFCLRILCVPGNTRT